MLKFNDMVTINTDFYDNVLGVVIGKSTLDDDHYVVKTVNCTINTEVILSEDCLTGGTNG